MLPGPHHVPPSLGRPDVARLGFFIAAYLAAAEFGHIVSITADGVPLTTFWPASGLLLATLALSRPRDWSIWLLAALGSNVISDVLLHGWAWFPAVGLGVAYGIEAALGAWLLRLIVDHPFSVPRMADVIGLTVAALTSCLAGGALVATIAKVSGAPFGPAWSTSWLGDVLGMITVGPLLFGWYTESPGIWHPLRWRVFELLGALVGVIVTMIVVTGDLVPLPLRVPAFVLPFLLWAAYRFELTGAALSGTLATSIGLWNSILGRGPYFTPGTVASQWALRAQSTMGVAGICILLLACVVAERRRTARERNALVADLQQALAEIKTLQGMIPICAWCHKVRDDAGFWQQIEKYLHLHTKATFSHGICPDCSEQQMRTGADETPRELSSQ